MVKVQTWVWNKSNYCNTRSKENLAHNVSENSTTTRKSLNWNFTKKYKDPKHGKKSNSRNIQKSLMARETPHILYIDETKKHCTHSSANNMPVILPAYWCRQFQAVLWSYLRIIAHINSWFNKGCMSGPNDPLNLPFSSSFKRKYTNVRKHDRLKGICLVTAILVTAQTVDVFVWKDRKDTTYDGS